MRGTRRREASYSAAGIINIHRSIIGHHHPTPPRPAIHATAPRHTEPVNSGHRGRVARYPRAAQLGAILMAREIFTA